MQEGDAGYDVEEVVWMSSGPEGVGWGGWRLGVLRVRREAV